MRSNHSAVVGGRSPLQAEPAQIWKARSFIHEHLEEELSLTKVAHFVHISPNHLSEKFKQVTGVKFVDYIAHARFEKARHLLPDRQLRISEIAFEVGFQSLSQFNRVFKRISGKSPTEYRAGEWTRILEAAQNGSDGDKPTETLADEMRSRPPGNAGPLHNCEALLLIGGQKASLAKKIQSGESTSRNAECFQRDAEQPFPNSPKTSNTNGTLRSNKNKPQKRDIK